jgi:signal transduction histidine kinase
MLLRWIHRDGRIVWAEHQRVPVFDQHGRWVAVEGVARDVTDRVEANRRLADSESLLRLLAENARDMIYRLAVVPRGLQYVSPAATRLTGRSPQEFLADPEARGRGSIRRIARSARDADTSRRPRSTRSSCAGSTPMGRSVCVEHRNSPGLRCRRPADRVRGDRRDITEPLAIQTRLRESESQLRRLAASLNSAREAERADVSRELHDELGQTLTGIKLEMTRTVRDLMRRGLEPQMIDRMQSMVGSIEVATETVRRLASTLRPPALDHLGLGAAIELEAARSRGAPASGAASPAASATMR